MTLLVPSRDHADPDDEGRREGDLGVEGARRLRDDALRRVGHRVDGHVLGLPPVDRRVEQLVVDGVVEVAVHVVVGPPGRDGAVDREVGERQLTRIRRARHAPILPDGVCRVGTTLWTNPDAVGGRTYSSRVAWSVGRATWVADVTDPDIAQQVGTRTFDRGQAYAVERRVRSLATRPDGMMLLGTIEGSGSETYQTIIEARPHPKGRSHLWSGRCSCPVARRLQARRGPHAHRAGRRPGPGRRARGRCRPRRRATHPVLESAPLVVPPHWSDVFGHVRPRAVEPAPVAERPEPRGDLMPAGLFVDTVYRDQRGRRGVPELSYGLRPTRWTRAGTWHRTLSWHDALPQWRPGIRFLPEHERIMGRLHDVARHGSGGTTYFSATPPLSLDASPDVWPLLREARAAGIEVMPGEGVTGPVHVVDDAASLVLLVKRAADGSGDLDLDVEIEGLPPEATGEQLYLGDPVHAVAVEGDDGVADVRAPRAGARPRPRRARVGARRAAGPGRRARPLPPVRRARPAAAAPRPVRGAAAGARAGRGRPSRRSSRSTSGSSATSPESCASTSATPMTASPVRSRRPVSAPSADATATPSPPPCRPRRRCARCPARCGPTSAATSAPPTSSSWRPRRHLAQHVQRRRRPGRRRSPRRGRRPSLRRRPVACTARAASRLIPATGSAVRFPGGVFIDAQRQAALSVACSCFTRRTHHRFYQRSSAHQLARAHLCHPPARPHRHTSCLPAQCHSRTILLLFFVARIVCVCVCATSVSRRLFSRSGLRAPTAAASSRPITGARPAFGTIVICDASTGWHKIDVMSPTVVCTTRPACGHASARPGRLFAACGPTSSACVMGE